MKKKKKPYKLVTEQGHTGSKDQMNDYNGFKNDLGSSIKGTLYSV